MRRLIFALMVLCLLAAILPQAQAAGCEVLVVRGDRPGHEGPMRWSHGHPVIVRPAGTRWGREELPEAGKFWIIEIPDIDARELQPYLESGDPDEHGEPRYIRAWRIMLDNLPIGVQSILETQGRVSVPYDNIRQYVIHARTGEPLPQNIGAVP